MPQTVHVERIAGTGFLVAEEGEETAAEGEADWDSEEESEERGRGSIFTFSGLEASGLESSAFGVFVSMVTGRSLLLRFKFFKVNLVGILLSMITCFSKVKTNGNIALPS